MQIATILGSPRARGNTATVLGKFEELMAQQRHEVTRISITDYEVNGCLGCQACQNASKALACRQQDDAVAIFKRMIASDAVVYATPLYTYGFTAQMKALIDREYCLVTGYGSPEYRSQLRGKPSALLVTCGGGIEENADLIQKVFDREGQYQEWCIVGKYVVPYCSTPDELGDEAFDVARQMARDIMVSCRQNSAESCLER
ncbi:MAG TPA: flavodoxin family protein [Anaerolineae bacterium]|nr:flavodoxin family protein [Anaerolineae bacterium]